MNASVSPRVSEIPDVSILTKTKAVFVLALVAGVFLAAACVSVCQHHVIAGAFIGALAVLCFIVAGACIWVLKG